MNKSFYRIALRFKTPTEEGKSVDFHSLMDDILEAIEQFNDKFRNWSKRLILCSLSNHLNLLLVIENDKDKVTTREIRSFTAYLYHEKGWKAYSRETSKLFEGVRFTKISINEANDELKSINFDTISDKQNKDIEELLSYIKKNVQNDNIVIDKTNFNEDMYIDELTDEQSLAIFTYLLETKDLGNSQNKKKDTISKIKNILLEWL